MQLTKHSTDKFHEQLDTYHVPAEWQQEVFNYLVLGFPPSGFFESFFACDMIGMLSRSHRLNTIPAMKALNLYMVNVMPTRAYGSAFDVTEWLKKTSDERRKILEDNDLIFTADEEIILTLKSN